MMHAFLFTFPSIKNNNTAKLSFTKTENGWNIHGATPHSGDCDPDGGHLLILNFKQNNTTYPSGIDLFLGSIWQDLNGESINEDQAQERFNDLTVWIKATNSSKPQWSGYNI